MILAFLWNYYRCYYRQYINAAIKIWNVEV